VQEGHADGVASDRGGRAVMGGTTRRSVLGAAMTASLATAVAAAATYTPLFAVAACGSSVAATRVGRAEPDVTVLRAAIAAKEQMIAMYEAARAAHPTLSGRLDPLISDSAAHLAELRRRLIEPARAAEGTTAERTTGIPGGASPSPPPAPGNRTAALAALRSAERAAAAAHVRQLRAVAPSLAQLLASIAACEATHVAALDEHGLAQ